MVAIWCRRSVLRDDTWNRLSTKCNIAPWQNFVDDECQDLGRVSLATGCRFGSDGLRANLRELGSWAIYIPLNKVAVLDWHLHSDRLRRCGMGKGISFCLATSKSHPSKVAVRFGTREKRVGCQPAIAANAICTRSICNCDGDRHHVDADPCNFDPSKMGKGRQVFTRNPSKRSLSHRPTK